jgi:hypothetical protein
VEVPAGPLPHSFSLPPYLPPALCPCAPRSSLASSSISSRLHELLDLGREARAAAVDAVVRRVPAEHRFARLLVASRHVNLRSSACGGARSGLASQRDQWPSTRAPGDGALGLWRCGAHRPSASSKGSDSVVCRLSWDMPLGIVGGERSEVVLYAQGTRVGHRR